MANRGKLIKLVGGAGLVIAGILGIVFGKNVKSFSLRICIMLISLVSIGAGVYLFKLGLDDKAIGRVGGYEVGGKEVQTLYYKGPEFFKAGVVQAAAHNPDLRRLHFKCPDGSKDFTVYITKLGIFGIPGDEVICDDGFPMVTYDLKRLKDKDRKRYEMDAGKRNAARTAKASK